MKTLTYWLHIILLSGFCCGILYAQSDSLRTATTEDDDDNTTEASSKGVLRLGLSGITTIKTLTLRGEYGIGSVRLHNATLSAGALRLAEFHLGNEQFTRIRKVRGVLRYSHDGIFAGVFGNDILGTRRDSTAIGLSGWRWGLRSTSGYAYTNANQEPHVGLLHTGGMVWTYLSTQSPTTSLSPTDEPRYRVFSNSVFGSHTGAMIRYGLGGGIGITLHYQRTMIYDNYSFWGWLGSGTLEGISQTLLGGLMEKQIRNSPRTVPIANLLLRSAVSFAFYQLRRSSQHFPFGGNTPLEFNQLNLGINVGL